MRFQVSIPSIQDDVLNEYGAHFMPSLGIPFHSCIIYLKKGVPLSAIELGCELLMRIDIFHHAVPADVPSPSRVHPSAVSGSQVQSAVCIEHPEGIRTNSGANVRTINVQRR